ncbi:MAG TPA: methylated-DNA--[protein]-cysteine S-methyltransferase [Gemmatimonadales bacterium]|nr:methylated-DNA--[protein]-cysteine S-methyltransferase [Gemmatimonadales bacterium]
MISTPPVAPARLPREAELHRAVDERDPSYEGLFVVGIRTTGIFCRPTCPSKPSLRENREFFASVDEATAGGYRPCLRCKPLELAGTHPAWVRSVLDLLDENPAAELGGPLLQRLGIHPAAARRYFLRSFGMTLQGYARARRLGLALDALQRGTPVLPAGFESGFSSDSGFRDAFKRIFGVTPTEARGLPPIVVTLIASPLGPLVAAATDSGLCMLEFADRKKLPQQAADLRRWFARPVVPGTNRFTDQVARELEEYFAGARREFSVPLVLGGTPFQETVWRELLRIPYGQTIAYEELARRIGKPSAQRAVGMANGRNRIPIVVPCHRVIQKNGQLRGYGGGLWRKKFLLDLEQKQREQ